MVNSASVRVAMAGTKSQDEENIIIESYCIMHCETRKCCASIVPFAVNTFAIPSPLITMCREPIHLHRGPLHQRYPLGSLSPNARQSESHILHKPPPLPHIHLNRYQKFCVFCTTCLSGLSCLAPRGPQLYHPTPSMPVMRCCNKPEGPSNLSVSLTAVLMLASHQRR